MMSRTLLSVVVVLPALLLAACGDDASADEPPEIEYGRDTCDRCNMIISEERYASGLVDEDGEKLVFDDTGEMVAFMQDDPEAYAAWRIWVHDYDSVEWIDGATAFYVYSQDTNTPMGTGVIAFKTREAAEAFAQENEGMVMDWQTLLSEWTMPMHGH